MIVASSLLLQSVLAENLGLGLEYIYKLLCTRIHVDAKNAAGPIQVHTGLDKSKWQKWPTMMKNSQYLKDIWNLKISIH